MILKYLKNYLMIICIHIFLVNLFYSYYILELYQIFINTPKSRIFGHFFIKELNYNLINSIFLFLNINI